MKCEQKLTASYNWSDEPLDTSDIDGLEEAIERVEANHEEKVLVRCEDRVADYDVYWNSKTDAVRIAAIAPGASYEVPENPQEGLEAFEGDSE